MKSKKEDSGGCNCRRWFIGHNHKHTDGTIFTMAVLVVVMAMFAKIGINAM